MKMIFAVFTALILLVSCKKEKPFVPRNFDKIEIERILEDSMLSVRAIEILNDKSLAFAANNGVFGLFNPKTKLWQTSVQKHDSLNLQFRAVSHTASDFFMLSIESPGLLFKTGENGKMTLVYKEVGLGVFYDALTFWNDSEGIAVGDSVNGCLSIIITRDGGQTWNKIPCDNLPEGIVGEGAFAASNTNIKVIGNKAWIATTHGNIYYTSDKGETWEQINTPIIQKEETEGIYSIDFYDENVGFAIGGDYSKPNMNVANKMRTLDGGKIWELVANNENPDYRSCVQFLPNRMGKELVAVGFKGVDFTNDFGNTWKHLSDESFYTIRFINDSTAYAAGAGGISKLSFK